MEIAALRSRLRGMLTALKLRFQVAFNL